MDQPNLRQSAWSRAKADAADTYSSTPFHVGGGLVDAACGALGLLIVSDDASAVDQVAATVLAVALGGLLVFAFVFAWHLACAPYRQREALRGAFSTALTPPPSLDLSLRNAYREGAQLAKKLEQKRSFARQELEASDDWATSVIQMMTPLAPEWATREFIEAGQDESSYRIRLQKRLEKLAALADQLDQQDK